MSDDAIIKLTGTTALGPPGPMVGFHGSLNPTLKPDPMLQTALDAALEDAANILQGIAGAHPGLPTSLEPFSFAVVDLTNDPQNTPGFGLSNPAYAGHNDTVSLAIGSLAKLLPLYAAHQLRSDAMALTSVTAPANIGDLANLMRKHYHRMGAADDTFPLIEDMFSIDAGGDIMFKTGGTQWPGQTSLITDVQLKAVDDGDHVQNTPSDRSKSVQSKLQESMPLADRLAVIRGQLTTIACREQLRLMAGWSNNVSASILIQAIGFPFLWKLANRSGLFRGAGWERIADPRKGLLEKPGGLFLGQDYSGNIWTHRPRGAPVFEKDSSQAGNARSIAQLLASLGAGELINDAAHISMREMLRKSDSFGVPLGLRGEDSPIGLAMAVQPSPGWRASQTPWDYGAIPDELSAEYAQLVNGELAVSKIGLVDLRKDGVGFVSASNGLLVSATRGTAAAPIRVTAVLVALTTSKDIGLDLLAAVEGAFGKAMAPYLDNRHP
jgi:hypothetical protein